MSQEVKMEFRILVTGSTGWLGQMTTKMIAERSTNADWEAKKVVVFAAYNKSEPPEWVPASQRAHLDMLNPTEILDVMRKIRPHAVIHLAAISSPVSCHKNPEMAMQVNCPVALVEALGACGLSESLFVFTSTDLVYDGEHPPYSPAHHLATPGTVYGRTKLAFEKQVLTLKNSVVLRLSNMIGPRHTYRAVGVKFTEWVYDSFQKKDVVSLRCDEVRSFVYVGDVLTIICTSLERAILSVNVGGIFNVGGPQGLTRMNLASLIVTELGSHLSVYGSEGGWKVTTTTNADSIAATGGGVLNPRDVTMDITSTESAFHLKFTDPLVAVQRTLKDF